MLIYQNKTAQFIQDVRKNKLTDMMRERFEARFGYRPSKSEINAWQHSVPKVRDLIEIADLTDNYIALEYEAPYSQSRIDCLLFGKNSEGDENVVMIELKQWSNVVAQDEAGNFEEKYNVETYTGGSDKIVPHPSQQVKGYQKYLTNFISAFEDRPPLLIFSCSYCHNYSKSASGLFDPIYTSILADFPIYTKEDTEVLADKIKGLLKAGDGFAIFNRFMQSPVKSSQKLLENVSRVIRNEAVFSLLNEQLVAKNLIWAKVRKGSKSKEKSVIIVHGGPGTGKSVIAINILAEAAQKGKQVFYGCKSKPFTEGLKNLVGREGELLFSNLYRFLPSKINENELDLLLVDEAHRVEKTSNHRFTKPGDKSDLPQIDQLIRCAKTAVFFIDDKQSVRSQEIGSSEMIRDAAQKAGVSVKEVTLNSQYRCMGSNDYLLWLESVLGYTDDERVLSKSEVFDFRIMDSPQEIYDFMRETEMRKPNSARMVAGFCWPWSNKLDSNGELVKDIVIGEFAMPWETHGLITKPPKGYVKWYEWGYKTEGIKQVGCIYTVQGFEYDYIGVIIGDDLRYNPVTNSLEGNIDATKDPTLKRSKEGFDSYVKNIYRALLSRAMKGCYVYFTNKETEKYFRKWIGG